MGTQINVQKDGQVKQINVTENGDVYAPINKDKPRPQDPKDSKSNPWISGSFYLVLFVIIISALGVIGKLFPLYYLPIIIVGTMLLFSVIGAFILRQDEKLSEKGFLELMLLTFKRIPALLKFSKPNHQLH